MHRVIESPQKNQIHIRLSGPLALTLVTLHPPAGEIRSRRRHARRPALAGYQTGGPKYDEPASSPRTPIGFTIVRGMICPHDSYVFAMGNAAAKASAVSFE
jgi:hypothetical protein